MAARVYSVRDWASLLHRSDVLIVDTETTGTGKWAEVLDVAVIDTRGAVRYHARALPANNIATGVDTSFGRIEFLALNPHGARPWPECHLAITELMRDASTVLAYNAAHDKAVLNRTSLRYGLRFPREQHWRCLMREYTAHVGHSTTLEQAAIQEGALMGRQEHESLPDCRLALSFMRAVAGQLAPETSEPARVSGARRLGRLGRLWKRISRTTGEHSRR